jgi:replication factor C small subunit
MGDIQQLWTEKYRPQSFSEVIGHKYIVKRIEAFVKQKNVPHLLFAGRAGIGKTTLAIVIAKQLFGETWKENFLDLNASDDRGIETIRVKVKDFARTKALGTDLQKLIHLDECDSLTKEAQQALRRTMETYSGNARFILSCNVQSKIIDPIKSRCAIFRFRPLEKKDMVEVMERITKEEKLHLDTKAIDALFDVCEGDMRRMVTMLQSVAAMGSKISEDAIYDLAGAVKPEEIKEALNVALKGDFLKARDTLLKVMLAHGMGGLDVVKQIQKEIWGLSLSDLEKVKLTERCGEIEFRLVEGSDEWIQLEGLLASFVAMKK